VETELRASADVAAVSIQRAGAAAVARAVDEQQKKRSAPARLVRVDQAKLDNLAGGMGELTVLRSRLDELANGSLALERIVHRLGAVVDELQDSVLTMRMVPVGDVFDRFHRLVRDVSRAVGKEIDFRIEGREIELDRSILDEIVDPLVHLLRNAVDHGIEGPIGRLEADKSPRGQLVLRALRERSSVVIQIQDDGRGVDAKKVLARARQAGIRVSGSSKTVSPDELLRILSHPGFSTAEQVTEVSGRGVGMDAVVNRVRALGGAIDMATLGGRGTTFTIRLPIALAVAQALRVRIAGEDYAIPLTHVSEALLLERGSILKRAGRETVHVRGEPMPLVRMRRVLGARAAGHENAAVIAEVGDRRSALAVDELVGREQILVKEFDGAVGTLPIFSGVTLLADGRPALVLDPLSVV
jgi:two-component system chemotaxis sensor kinase CheA